MPPEGCETLSFQSAPADCRMEGVEHRLEQVIFALWASTPLTTIVHSHTGRRIVIHPALGAGGIGAARYRGADAFLSTVEADVRRTAAADPGGEGWGCNC
jgi:hypothetical protein